MPQAFVEKTAKEEHMSTKEAEGVWDRAKKAAGNKADYGIITNIFKSMMNERGQKKAGKSKQHK